MVAFFSVIKARKKTMGHSFNSRFKILLTSVTKQIMDLYPIDLK